MKFQKRNMMQILSKKMIKNLQKKKLVATQILFFFFFGKRGTKWKKDPPDKSVRTKFRNVVTILQHVKR